MKKNVTIVQPSMILTLEGREVRQEVLAIETPYTVSLNEKDIGTSMVLETGLEEFGAGFLFGQGYIRSSDEVKEVFVCPEGRISVYADVDEERKPEVSIITSGCGGTGKISREMLEGVFETLPEYSISFKDIHDFILETLHYSQLGNSTHCVHGCGFWAEGKLQAFHEDVGRHNAVDKVIGAVLLKKVAIPGVIYTTGRLTSDMVLKCARIGISVIISRTSASSLGLALARKADVTLIVYARPNRLNVLHGAERIVMK